MLTFMATRLESPTGAPTPYVSGSELYGDDSTHHMDFISYLEIQVMAWNFVLARTLVSSHLRHQQAVHVMATALGYRRWAAESSAQGSWPGNDIWHFLSQFADFGAFILAE